METQIEQLREADREGFTQMLKIYSDSILPSEQKPASVLAELLADPRYSILIARVDNSVRGFAILFFPAGRDFWLLEYMATTAKGRSRGLGTALFKAAQATALEREPLSACVLEVDEPDGSISEHNNPSARLRFYARLGCRKIEGLDYILPLAASGLPPPMWLLVCGLVEKNEISRQTLKRWLSTIYSEVYNCSPDDPRIDTMLSNAGEKLQLRSLHET